VSQPSAKAQGAPLAAPLQDEGAYGG
jgi:hypothetical protein